MSTDEQLKTAVELDGAEKGKEASLPDWSNACPQLPDMVQKTIRSLYQLGLIC